MASLTRPLSVFVCLFFIYNLIPKLTLSCPHTWYFLAIQNSSNTDPQILKAFSCLSLASVLNSPHFVVLRQLLTCLSGPHSKIPYVLLSSLISCHFCAPTALSHISIKGLLLDGNIPIYLYVFLTRLRIFQSFLISCVSLVLSSSTKCILEFAMQ